MSTSMTVDHIPDLAPGVIWRHVKSGNRYVIVGRCMLEATWRPAVLYQCVDPGLLDYPIARDMAEFLDGRFELVTEADFLEGENHGC